jgi:hypothetical protein
MDLAGTSQGCTTKATQMPMHPQVCVYVWCVGQTYYWQPLWLLQGCCLGWQAHSGGQPTRSSRGGQRAPLVCRVLQQHTTRCATDSSKA